MVIIVGSSLLNNQDKSEKNNLVQLISQLPLVFMGETIFKGCFCLSRELLQKLLDLLVEIKEDIQKIDININQDLLTAVIIVRKKNISYGCQLKIEKIEINAKNNNLILYLYEPPQLRTNNVWQNLFVGLGTLVANLKSGEEFILKYLIGNKKGFEYSEKKLKLDLKKISYINEIYNKQIFGLNFIDVVNIREVSINEGVVEIYWDVTIPSAKSLKL